MRKLLLLAIVLLNSNAMGMQHVYSSNAIERKRKFSDLSTIDGTMVQKIAPSFGLKDLVTSVLSNKQSYEDCTDEEQYSIAIQVEINLWSASKFDGKFYDSEYYRIKNNFISADTVNNKLKALLQDPSIICFAKEWEQGLSYAQGRFMYAEEYTDKNQLLRFFPMHLIELHENITKLYIRNQQLHTISGSIGQLTQLTHLDLCGNHLKNLPAAIICLYQLRCIDLSQNEFDHMPEYICELINLENINISDNKLTYIPYAICRLTKLRILFLDHNKLTDLSQQISKMQELQCLSIAYNQLREIPVYISISTTLKRLDIRYNSIHNIEHILNHPLCCEIIYSPQADMYVH